MSDSCCFYTLRFFYNLKLPNRIVANGYENFRVFVGFKLLRCVNLIELIAVKLSYPKSGLITVGKIYLFCDTFKKSIALTNFQSYGWQSYLFENLERYLN